MDQPPQHAPAPLTRAAVVTCQACGARLEVHRDQPFLPALDAFLQSHAGCEPHSVTIDLADCGEGD